MLASAARLVLDGGVSGSDSSFHTPAAGGIADDHDRGLVDADGQPAATVAEHLEEQFVKPGPGGKVSGTLWQSTVAPSMKVTAPVGSVAAASAPAGRLIVAWKMTSPP